MRCVSLQGESRICPVCESTVILDDKCYSLNVLSSINFENMHALKPALSMLEFWEKDTKGILRIGLKSGSEELIMCEKCTKEIVSLVQELKGLLNAQ